MGPQEITFYKDLENIKKKKKIKIRDLDICDTTSISKSYDPKESTCGLKEYQKTS